jgi:uncharacterized protein YjlB
MDTPTTTQPGPESSGRQALTDDDAARWREAALVRGEHPGWVVIWLARVRRYHAYHRFTGAQRDTVLIAATSGELAAKIVKAERAAAAAPPKRSNRRRRR